MTKKYLCGHYANMGILSNRISLDQAVSDLILDQAVSGVLCYPCLKELYDKNNLHAEPGFRAWHKGSAISSRAYGHLLRHIAILSGIECNIDNIFLRYWIETIWGIKNEIQDPGTARNLYGDKYNGTI